MTETHPEQTPNLFGDENAESGEHNVVVDTPQSQAKEETGNTTTTTATTTDSGGGGGGSIPAITPTQSPPPVQSPPPTQRDAPVDPRVVALRAMFPDFDDMLL